MESLTGLHCRQRERGGKREGEKKGERTREKTKTTRKRERERERERDLTKSSGANGVTDRIALQAHLRYSHCSQSSYTR